VSYLTKASLEDKRLKMFTILTKKEEEILNMIKDGKTNKQISQELFVSLNTVTSYVSIVLDKLECRRYDILKEKGLLNVNTVLTPIEINIVKMIKKGKTNREIATQCNKSLSTINYHIKNIFKKLNITNRKEIIVNKIIVRKIVEKFEEFELKY